MKLGTANIRNFPDLAPAQVRADARTIGQHCTLWGGQEIQPMEDTPVVLEGLHLLSVHSRNRWGVIGEEFECPIFYRMDLWEPSDVHTIKFRRPRLSRPQNRHAGVVSAAFASRSRLHLPAFAVVNTHLVSGGHNEPHDREIAEQWEREFASYRAACHYHHAANRTAFTTGDLNDPRPPHVGRTHQWLTPNGVPDHIGQAVHSGSVLLESGAVERVKLHSDHPLIVVSGPLARARV